MSATAKHIRSLTTHFPWTKTPLIIQAPMRLLSGPKLAVAVSSAGGLGFVGPGAKPDHLESVLVETTKLISGFPTLSSLRAPLNERGTKINVLPVGIGIQTWAGNLQTTIEILEKAEQPPAIVWLFAPRHGQDELNEWAAGIRSACRSTQIWIQVASVADAVAAARSSQKPDVLVVQGTDAGGHSRTKGAGIITLLPEVRDALDSAGITDIPLIAAGGIADARGVAAGLTLGAAGVAMGTRFLASHEAEINAGYQRHILSATDGGQTTVRTQLYNHLRGTTNWPEPFDARGLINASWRDHKAGVSFEKNKEMHDEAMKKGEAAWGENGRTATYAGTNVGLVRDVKAAPDIVREVRAGIENVLTTALNNAGH
jgi:nitronate monooxygenase